MADINIYHLAILKLTFLFAKCAELNSILKLNKEILQFLSLKSGKELRNKTNYDLNTQLRPASCLQKKGETHMT